MVIGKAAGTAEPVDSVIGGEGGSTANAAEAVPEPVLVDRARGGDWSASEELFRRYRDRAFAVAYRMSAGDREEALDLTQDAFLAAFRNLRKFEGKSSFYTWFYRILVNTCLDAYRKRKRRWRLFGNRPSNPDHPERNSDDPERHADQNEASDPLSSVAARQLQQKAQQALALLSERQRMIFQLKVFEELSISEIAQSMGLAQGTVKSHLFRATRIMRNALAEWAEH
jgi:RNA polymerase sigma-70 factor (ECF subfamily)